MVVDKPSVFRRQWCEICECYIGTNWHEHAISQKHIKNRLLKSRAPIMDRKEK